MNPLLLDHTHECLVLLSPKSRNLSYHKRICYLLQLRLECNGEFIQNGQSLSFWKYRLSNVSAGSVFTYLLNVIFPCEVGRWCNPLYFNGLFLLVWCNKLGIVQCTNLGVSVFFCFVLNIVFFCLIYKQCRPWWNAALCCISFGSSVFTVCKTTCIGFSQIQGANQ